MNLKTFSLAVLLCLAGNVAAAQTTDDVEITVSAYTSTANAGEKRANASLSSWPTTTGETRSGLFSMSGCGNFSVRYPPAALRFDESTTAGWMVEITPMRIVDHAVTFRLHWTRALDPNKGAASTGEDVEVTLKPSESRTIDSVPIAFPAGSTCAAKTGSLRVSAQFPDWDNRLIGADVWLVERLGDGTEKSQLQTVRGIPHVRIPFYFDRIGDVDLFGTLLTDLTGGLSVAVEIVRAQVNDSDSHGYQAARWDRSTAHLGADEVIEIPLPKLEERFGPYAKRTFALRIKARRLH